MKLNLYLIDVPNEFYPNRVHLHFFEKTGDIYHYNIKAHEVHWSNWLLVLREKLDAEGHLENELLE